jgi:hypothetical protein
MSNSKVQMKPNQKYLKFPLTLPSPQRGEGKGEGAKNVRRKFLDSTL